MDIQELRKRASDLKSLNVIDSDEDIMRFVDLLPSPIFYIINPIKLESFLRGKGYSDSETLECFIVSNFGQEAFELLSRMD